jgi:hypothetical protein
MQSQITSEFATPPCSHHIPKVDREETESAPRNQSGLSSVLCMFSGCLGALGSWGVALEKEPCCFVGSDFARYMVEVKNCVPRGAFFPTSIRMCGAEVSSSVCSRCFPFPLW